MGWREAEEREEEPTLKNTTAASTGRSGSGGAAKGRISCDPVHHTWQSGKTVMLLAEWGNPEGKAVWWGSW